MDRTVVSLLCFALCVSALRPADSQSRAVLHDYMLFLYQTFTNHQPSVNNGTRGSGLANTVTTFVDQGKDLPSWERGQRYIFDLSSLPRVDDLVEAELRILRKPVLDLLSVLTTGGNLYNISLFSCSAERSSEIQLLHSRTVDVLDGGLPRWEVFDVWSSIKTYLRNQSELPEACFHLLALSELTKEVADPLLLGLGRYALPPQHKALLVTFSHTDTKDSLFTEIMEKMKNGEFRLPHLVKSTEKHHKKRRRYGQRAVFKRSFRTGRGAADGGTEGKSGYRKSRCSRKPLRVNFKDLGWDDWIIAPLAYEANQCYGVCDFPLRSHLDPTNHAVIQTLINSIDPAISPPSCCVPSKLSPIGILYIDSRNNVVYKQYEDMVVESCGCR